MIIDKTDLYLILNKSKELGGRVYLRYTSTDNTSLNTPVIKIFIRIYDILNTRLGLQLNIGNEFGNYINLNKSVKSMNNDFEFKIEYKFDVEVGDRGIYFFFSDEKICYAYIYITNIDKNSFENILNNIYIYKKDYKQKEYEDQQERKLYDEMMPDGFWDSIDNMMNK